MLGDIRKLVSSKDFEKAEQIAKAALDGIQQTDQNKFYLNQIQEETKIYYEQAKIAMSQEQYSLASKLLEKYRSLHNGTSRKKNSERGGPFEGWT